MRGQEPRRNDEDDDASRRGPLMAMAVIAVLAVIGLALVFYLKRESAIEDCLLSGRRDCDHIIDGR
jgi:hypothetical protein